jgi:hypothetical protein
MCITGEARDLCECLVVGVDLGHAWDPSMEFGGLFQLRIADDEQWSSLRVRSELGSGP